MPEPEAAGMPSSRSRGRAAAAQFHRPVHRFDRVDRGDLRRHRRGRRLHLGPAALLLQRVDSRFLRLRPAAARHPDLLGHRRDLAIAAPTSRSISCGPMSGRNCSAPSTSSPRWCCCSWSLVHTYTLYDKVAATRADNVLTFDLRLPTWPFFAVAWLGDVAAVILIAVQNLSADLPSRAAWRGPLRCSRWNDHDELATPSPSSASSRCSC